MHGAGNESSAAATSITRDVSTPVTSACHTYLLSHPPYKLVSFASNEIAGSCEVYIIAHFRGNTAK